MGHLQQGSKTDFGRGGMEARLSHREMVTAGEELHSARGASIKSNYI